MPALLLEPADSASAATMLAGAREQGRQLIPRGGGTKGPWRGSGTPAQVLSTRKLTAGVSHYAGDLVATISAGTTVGEANAELARAGQWLPLDPPYGDRATIGGVVATNDSGPRRHKHGAPRDLIIGIEIALTDGRVARAGGRVVKNVAGYDLSRLMCGSFGCLAVITSATFKLAPLSVASATVAARLKRSDEAARLALMLAAAPVTPSALEIEAPVARLLVRFETTERAAAAMAGTVQALLDREGADAEILTGDSEREAWRHHDQLVWHRPGVVLKVSVLPTEVGGLLGEIERVAMAASVEWSAIGRGALGVLLVRLNGTPTRLVEIVSALQSLVPRNGGHVSIVDAPSELRPQLGGSRAVSDVARAIKQRFDPHGVLPALDA